MKNPATFAAILSLTFTQVCAAIELNPPKLAGIARLDLNAGASVIAIQQGTLVEGSGLVLRQTWLPAAEQPRTYTIELPIVRFAWNEFAVRFVPDGSGAVQISLRGPWEEVAPGAGRIYKQEVLWDGVSATGSSVPNGGFEFLSGGSISGWSGGISQTGTSLTPAPEGQRMGRAWHDNSMNCTLTVSAGVPVVLRFFARAVIPANFEDMQPIASRNTAAHQTAQRLLRGVNFGGYLETPPNSPKLPYTAEDFALARAEGFDHVRVPVAWHFSTGPAPEFTIAPAQFELVDFMVTNALSHGLTVIVDVHHFEEFTMNPTAFTNKLYAMWRQLATHYAQAPPTLVFEVLNEPRDAATTQLMNPIFAEAVRQIRLTNPHRTLLIGPGAFNGISELNNLILPDGDSNLIATVHTYEPFLFTHQGQPWAGPDAAALGGLVFPGPPAQPLTPSGELNEWAANWLKDYHALPSDQNPSGPASFRGRLEFLRQWSAYYGRPVHVGEFGAFETADAQSRINYYREMRSALDEAGLGWAIWDWKAGFHYMKDGRPEPPGIRDALFPPPALQAVGPGDLLVGASPGKWIVVERAFEFGAAQGWQPISTQLVSATSLQFKDTGGQSTSFYRLRWLK